MILTETRTVYRAEGTRRLRLSKAAAYRDAARIAWAKKYPRATSETRRVRRRMDVLRRLVRLWMHRDRKAVSK